MLLALILVFLWLTLAMRRHAPMPPWVLVVTGVPLLGLITVQFGAGLALACLGGGAWMLWRSMLRAPETQSRRGPLQE